MTFNELKNYVCGAMHRGMQHVYQPVMLKTLLRAGGRATTTDIAKAILAYD
jgi:ATP adenylyltransferase